MSKEQLYSIIVSGAFLSFLLTFMYAVIRWSLADAKSRGKAGWPLAALMVVVPISAYAARLAFPSLVPRWLSLIAIFAVPVVAWGVWLAVRPAVQRKSSDAILSGRDGAASRWILSFCVVAAGYNVAMGVLSPVIYALYLAVPPASFPTYFAKYNEAIVLPVNVALSFTWVLFVILILYRPTVIPSWAAWSAAALSLVGFVASAIFEFPYNQELMEHGYNANAINAKIWASWFRLIPWTLQAALIAWMTNLALGAAYSKRAAEHATP